MNERYELVLERIMRITSEETVKEPYRSFFQHVAHFLLRINEVKETLHDEVRDKMTKEHLEAEMNDLYYDVLPENYATSYANPAYAVAQLGEELGAFLSAVYAELRSDIYYVHEERLEYLVIGNELFVEIYNRFEAEEEPSLESLKEIFYWYASDYCDVIAADRIREQIDPQCSEFVTKIIMESDLTDLRYLYKFGEYISENEWKTAEYLNSLPEEIINKMADTYTEGYRVGFVRAGKPLEIKRAVNIRYVLGFERVVRKAIQNFEAMGLKTTCYRIATSVITRPRVGKNGYYGALINKQYDYDHKDDIGLVLDKQFVERKMEVTRTTYEQNKQLAREFAGPAVMMVFGEKPFSPSATPEAIHLTAKQEELLRTMNSKESQITNQYIIGEERSFTIISWPIPEIGEQYKEIFDEVIRINTLDADAYGEVQQTIIDALDKGEYAHILGKDGNKTDLKIALHPISDPEKETVFENCMADVNIPVGEVFTTPVLEGTEGKLFVSKVYLNGLQYENLEIDFADGKTTDYTCTNFEKEEDCKKYISDNLLFNHPSLPMGEFAIGTNTTAYVVAEKYQIADKFPILIAEKMGPHFAIGDTCFSWAEDNKIYNPNGKEIIAKDNSVSIQRKESPEKAYLQCHTDITIPYDELGKISVFTKDGEEIVIVENGRFVLPGTDLLNEPFEK